MNTCEVFEAAVSAWLDEELSRAEQVEVVDHLVRCGDCRRFYLDARALDGTLGVLRPPRGAEPPVPEVWQKIARATTVPGTRRAVPAWALRAAAVLVLSAGIAGLWWSKDRVPSAPPADALIALGEDAGRMSEERFLELTAEILRSEPRYRSAMYRVMRQVVGETTAAETTTEAEFAGSSTEELPVREITGRDPV